MSLRIRRGTDAQRQAVTFLEGELVYTTDTKKLYVGDGSTQGGNSVDTSVGSINSLSDVNTAGVQIGQILVWNGTAFVPGEQGTGESIFGADSTLLVDATNSSINLDGTVKGHVVPDQNIAYDLGSASNRFRDLYLSGNTIDLGGATISSTASKISFNQPIVAEFEMSDNMDLKDNFITNTAASGTISVRPAATSNFEVATVDGVKLFEVRQTGNWFGATDNYVLQLPIFQTSDYTGHSAAEGQVVYDAGTNGLKVYNGTGWADMGGAGGGLVEGQAYRINVVDGGSTIMVNTDTSTFTGNLTGNVTSTGVSTFDDILVNGGSAIDGTPIGPNVASTVRGTTVTATTEFVGDLTGDTTGNHTGDVVGNVTGNIDGDLLGNIQATGFLFGSVEGTLQGDVIRTNSTLMINGETGDIDIENANIDGVFTNSANDFVFRAPSGNFTRLTSRRQHTGTLGTNDTIGRFTFQREATDTQNIVTIATTSVTEDQLLHLPAPGGTINYNYNWRFWSTGKFAINTPQADLATEPNATLEVYGDAKVGTLKGGVQTISGPGAVDLDNLITEITTTGADAFTLGNGVTGQMKIIIMTVDGGDATITPTTFSNGTSITLDDVNDNITMVYGANGWVVTALQGATVNV